MHAQNDNALVNASRKGHLETVRLLLDRGADVHARNDHALRFAAQRGRLETVRLLLDRGADVHAQNDAAIRVARRQFLGKAAVAALLLERGAAP